MNRYTYTLPSGSTFTMTTPDSTTQLQADAIFYGQVASGRLVGLTAGQSVGTIPQQVVKFALSRLDRGTAGVDDRVILSIVNGIPAISGVPNLINVPLTNPITQSDISNIGTDTTFSPSAIGPLNPNQVQGLLAQIANFVAQPANVMTNDKGVGQYGFDCQQLEQSGYVKPGTYKQFIFDPSPLTDVLSAPGIWTGKNGITSVTQFLNDPSAQSDAMTNLLSQSYNSLTAVGTITPPITKSLTAAVGQVYNQSGLQTVSQLSAATGITLPTSLSSFGSVSPAISNLISAPLTNVGSLASGAINNFTSGALQNVTSIASNLSNTVTGGVAALVSNGGVFGTTAASLWSKSGSLDSLISGSGIAGGQAFNQLTGALGGSISGLTSNLTGSLTNLTGGLTSLTNNIGSLDVLGKASEFASTFSNPLSSLSNLGNFNLGSLTSGLPDLGSLTNLSGSITGAISGQLGSLTGALSGQLGSLTGALSGQLGSLTSSLGSLGNLGSLASLPGLGSLGDLGGLFGGGGDALVSGVQVAAGYSNTVNRSEVDVAFSKILGSAKIPRPVFDFPSPNSISLGASTDISFAKNVLQGLRTAGTAITDFGSGLFSNTESTSA